MGKRNKHKGRSRDANRDRDKPRGTNPENTRTRDAGSKRESAQANPRHRLFYFFFGYLLLLIPLVFFAQAVDRSLMPRLFALALLLLITGAIVFGGKPMRDLDFSVFRRWIFPLLGLFVLTTVISALFATNTREVYFDMVKTVLFAGGLSFSALLMLRTPDWPEKLSKLAVVAAIPTLFIGAVQYVQRVVLADGILLPDGRIVEYAVTGLMAHKNIYSVFLMLLLPFTVFGIYRLRGKWQVASVGVTSLILLMILLLKTRSAWVGIAAGVFVALVLLILFARQFQFPVLWRNWAGILLAGGVIGLAVLMWVGKTAEPYSFPGRVRSIVDTRSPHNIHRLNVWNGTVQMVKDHPILGVGPGNWKIHAPMYYDQQFDRLQSISWARPHNDFLWVASEKGIVSLMLYLGMLIMGLYYLFRVLGQSPDAVSPSAKVLALCLFAGLVAYLGDSLFSFPYERIEIQVLLFVMLSAAVVLYHPLKQENPLALNRKVLLVLSLVVFGLASLYGHHVTKNEAHSRRMIAYRTSGEWHGLLKEARAGKSAFRSLDPSLNPVEYYEGVAYAGLGRFPEAIAAFESARRQSPGNVYVMRSMGIAYHNMGMHREAIQCMEGILEIIPGLRNILNNIAVFYYELGEYEKALETFKRIENWEEDPEIAEGVRVLEEMLGRGS